MNRNRLFQWIVAPLIGVLLLFFVASSLRIIEFRYPRAVENDPLLFPVNVQSVTGNTLVLEDGRTLHVDAYHGPLDEIVQESGFRIDVETDRDDSSCVIFVSRRRWICGTPWAASIRIPLIADDVPVNHREEVGTARIVPRDDDNGT